MDRIEVRLEKETNDHLLTVYFQLGLVGDGIEYTDTDKGYTVVEGGRDASVVVSRKKAQEMHKDARITGRNNQVKKRWTYLPPTKIVPSRWSSLVRW